MCSARVVCGPVAQPCVATATHCTHGRQGVPCSVYDCVACAMVCLQSHEPASCSEMLRWMEAGGFCEGMDSDHKSKLLERTIAKKCPKCYIPIQKNEGCLQ